MLMDNPHFAACANSIRELHGLIRNGMGESSEADAIRDATDVHWALLDRREIDWLQCLSADLYTIGEDAGAEAGAEVSLCRDKIDEVLRAVELDQVDRVMTLIRELGPESLRMFVRASYWTKLGDFESTQLFLDEAVRLDPGSMFLHLARLNNLWASQDGRALGEAKILINHPNLRRPDDAIRVSTILVLSVYHEVSMRANPFEGLSDAESEAIEHAIRRLQESLSNQSDTEARPTPAYQMIANHMLGLCFWWRAEVGPVEHSVAANYDVIVSELPPIELMHQMAGRIERECRRMFFEVYPLYAA
jgi:hypothetical protein